MKAHEGPEPALYSGGMKVECAASVDKWGTYGKIVSTGDGQKMTMRTMHQSALAAANQ